MRDYLELPVEADTDYYRLELHVFRKDATLPLVVWNFTSAARLDGFWHIHTEDQTERGIRKETEYLVPSEDVSYFKLITHWLDRESDQD